LKEKVQCLSYADDDPEGSGQVVLLKREITFAMPFQVGTNAGKVILVLIA